ncbi:MAG: hypothetical protein ABSH32_22020 [Bryobacteraceae bacterium]|jgi:hypothetical protein
MFSLRTQSEQALAAMLLLGALTLSVASAESLTIVNPNFSAVAVQCSSGWAYESYMGGNCESVGPEQDFNSEVGIGWRFATGTYESYGSGITNANTSFNPPPFTGLPFSQAAIVQGSGAVRAAIAQKITGFLPGQVYKLTFYLGSRYADGCCDGNQTVLATLDGKPIGFWKLVSFTPFTLRTAVFRGGSGLSHILEFSGQSEGDHTAFFSDVGIETVAGQE